MALIFRGSKFSRIALLEHFVEKISRIRGKTPRPHNRRGVLYSPDSALEDFRARLNSTRYHRPLRRCVVFCDTLFPTSTFSEFVFRYLGKKKKKKKKKKKRRYLGVPLTFAGSSWQLPYWQIPHVRWYLWENSPCGSGSLHFDYCPSSLLKYTNRAIKLAVTSVASVRWNTVRVAVGAQHLSKFSLK